MTPARSRADGAVDTTKGRPRPFWQQAVGAYEMTLVTLQ